jgi:hypothetical protein
MLRLGVKGISQRCLRFVTRPRDGLQAAIHWRTSVSRLDVTNFCRQLSQYYVNGSGAMSSVRSWRRKDRPQISADRPTEYSPSKVARDALTEGIFAIPKAQHRRRSDGQVSLVIVAFRAMNRETAWS